jgi:hypothetical protein
VRPQLPPMSCRGETIAHRCRSDSRARGTGPGRRSCDRSMPRAHRARAGRRPAPRVPEKSSHRSGVAETASPVEGCVAREVVGDEVRGGRVVGGKSAELHLNLMASFPMMLLTWAFTDPLATYRPRAISSFIRPVLSSRSTSSSRSVNPSTRVGRGSSRSTASLACGSGLAGTSPLEPARAVERDPQPPCGSRPTSSRTTTSGAMPKGKIIHHIEVEPASSMGHPEHGHAPQEPDSDGDCPRGATQAHERGLRRSYEVDRSSPARTLDASSCPRASGKLRLQDVGHGAAGADAGRNRGERGHHEHSSHDDGEQLPERRGRCLVVAQSHPERETSGDT